MGIPIVILSHRRAGAVTSHKFVANTMLCIEEGQVDEYAKHHSRDKFIVHPNSVRGGCNKRQWMLENIGDVFCLDDDINGMSRIWRPKGHVKKSVVSPDRAYDIIQNTAATARAFGAKLFGFSNHASPITYHPLKPFRFGGYITGGAMGMFKEAKYTFPDSTLPISDFWACLHNAYHHRYSFIDTRFGFGFAGTYSAVGGSSEYRTENSEAEAYAFLRKHFGECVQPGVGVTGATKTQKNRAKRQIRLPYNA